MPDARHAALAAVTSIVVFGTIYSVNHSTYLDTSNPLLTNLPHPLHVSHYFASKSNLLNVLFIKRVWGWTSAAFLFHFFTSPRHTRTKERVGQYLAATAIWLCFTSWFFGPPVLERLISSTGGECVLALPSGAVVTVPTDYCYAKTALSPATHPTLFAASLLLPDAGWHARPRLRRGHDVSGHIFLLTLSALFLADQLRASFASLAGSRPAQVRWSPLHRWAVILNGVVVSLLLFATYTTSVYFHTPVEKLSGYLLGVGAFAITQLPVFRPAPVAPVITNKPISETEREKNARS